MSLQGIFTVGMSFWIGKWLSRTRTYKACLVY